MSINREQRRKVADNLAALMRGEITYADYLTRGEDIKREIEESNSPDKFALYNATFQWMNPLGGDHTLSVDEPTWKAMFCRLAFLESNLKMKRTGYDTLPGPGIWAILTSVVAAVTLGYLYCIIWIGFGKGTGPWFLIVLWCGLGLGTCLATDIHARLPRTKEARDHFHPFNDKRQFREYECLLTRFNLPAYDPTEHELPVKNACSASTCVLGGISVVLLTLLRSALPMIFGPLLLIGALKPSRRPRYAAVKEGES